MGLLVEARSSETTITKVTKQNGRKYVTCHGSSRPKKSSELIRSELVCDETELAASDSSFNRLGRGEGGVKNRPSARRLHAAKSPGHNRRRCMGVKEASRNQLFGVLILTATILGRTLWPATKASAWRCQAPCHPAAPNTRDRQEGCLACIMSRSAHSVCS